MFRNSAGYFHKFLNGHGGYDRSGVLIRFVPVPEQFYGLFKQAKEGSCTEPRPGFWDVIKKAKWYDKIVLTSFFTSFSITVCS